MSIFLKFVYHCNVVPRNFVIRLLVLGFAKIPNHIERIRRDLNWGNFVTRIKDFQISSNKQFRIPNNIYHSPSTLFSPETTDKLSRKHYPPVKYFPPINSYLLSNSDPSSLFPLNQKSSCIYLSPRFKKWLRLFRKFWIIIPVWVRCRIFVYLKGLRFINAF